jgi:hypothetical protein
MGEQHRGHPVDCNVAAHLWCARCGHPSAGRLQVNFAIGSCIGFWQTTQQKIGSFAST